MHHINDTNQKVVAAVAAISKKNKRKDSLGESEVVHLAVIKRKESIKDHHQYPQVIDKEKYPAKLSEEL